LEAPCLWSWIRPHGIWKEIYPVGAPNCSLPDLLRIEEFVILEVSLCDQFGFKNGSCTILWHNDTTSWCNYTPCNHQVHLNLCVDLHLLVGLFPQSGCRLCRLVLAHWRKLINRCANQFLLWGCSATCNLEIGDTVLRYHAPSLPPVSWDLGHVHWQRWCWAALHWLHWT
jgi:hypothetical protein